MLLLAPPLQSSPMPDLDVDGIRAVPSPFLLTTSTHESERDQVWPAHQHPEHELLWSERGVVTMRIDGRRWTIAPGTGLWIPAGAEHSGSAPEGAVVRTTFFDPEGLAKAWHQPTGLSLHPAVRELLVHLGKTSMSADQRIRAQQVCIDMLLLTSPVQLDVPVPQDPRLSALVEAVLEDPADDRSLEQWAAMLNLSSRTLTRLFAAELTMSFARWRRMVRMRAAIAQLADGNSVKVVARRVGYSSTSAFVAAFHKTAGCTPGDLAEQL